MKKVLSIMFRFITKCGAEITVSELETGYLFKNRYCKDRKELKKNISEYIDYLIK